MIIAVNQDKTLKLKSRNHMTFRLCYHLILTLKYRKDILTQEMQDRLKQILTTLLVKWECEPIELGGEGDHIHILFDAYPGLNLVNFIKNLKAVSSRHMRKEYKEYLEKHLWGGEFWNDGSTIISVGASASIEVLITYIKNQGKADKP
ncbi:IS200/IS605 family transposase [Microseira sp. BLCC-F43]|jgi:putative transposase|uniref:IS200/IS605 family transposase n=1 Tax=Microseira sp. BLCC-F43 TaxID=3153602 RepID=UPI0035B947A3